MKGLLLFAVGFSVGCGICVTGIGTGWIAGLIAVSGGLLGLSLHFRKRFAALGVAAVIFAGVLTGGGWYLLFRAAYLGPAIDADGQTRSVTVQLTDYSSHSDYGSSAEGIVKLDGRIYKVCVYLGEEKSLGPGDEITGSFLLRITTHDGAEKATYHRGKGIFLIAYQQGTAAYTLCEEPPWWCFPAVLRGVIKGILAAHFSGDALAFAQALLLGDGSLLSYELDTAFKISGIRHVIAVSGLHVSILYSFVSVITMKRRYLTALVGAPVLLLFAAVAGFTPSVTRACIMVGLMIAAMALNREYDPPTALAFAVVVMLVSNPFVIINAGFQLSVASVGGIFLLQKPICGVLQGFLPHGKGIPGRIGEKISSSVGVTLGATLLTAPLSAGYFGAVSLVAILTNLLTLWAVSYIFYGIIGVCLLGLFWSGGASFLAAVVSLPVRYVLAVAKCLADIPMAAVYTRSGYMTAWLVFVYILLLTYILSTKKHTGVLCCCAVLGLCLAQTGAIVEPMLDECRVTVLDVGQGQSVLLQSEGKTYMVDCGGSSAESAADAAAETLLTMGIRHLDGIILTHYDEDHIGGVANLLTRIDTDLLVMPVDQDGEGAAIAAETEATAVYLSEDMQITWGGASIRIFAAVNQTESNENGLCILFQTENCDILITGDRSTSGERELLRRTELPLLEVLIAGHHGSKYSTGYPLLEATQPEIVVISVGAGNWYGHPAQETLDRLTEYDCQIYRTDQNGTVIFRR